MVPLLNDEEDELESGLQVEGTSKQLPPSYNDSVIYKPNNLDHDNTEEINASPPQNHFVLALVTLFCCCWPFSLAALIKSNEVNHAFIAGDIVRAKKASKDAKKYSMISIVVGIGMWILLAIATIYYFSVFLPKMIDTLQDQFKRNGTI